MIDLFKKLSREGFIKTPGHLLDLGCGNGSKDMPFIEAGYSMTLVDKSSQALSEAKENIHNLDIVSFVESSIESFKIEDSYQGVLAINSLPFLNDKEAIIKVVRSAYERLEVGGFLYFTLFGLEDEWAQDSNLKISFFSLEEAGSILGQKPYYTSEDKGIGAMMKGGTKWWHILHFLYIKN